jgi:hypothetical protein
LKFTSRVEEKSKTATKKDQDGAKMRVKAKATIM